MNYTVNITNSLEKKIAQCFGYFDILDNKTAEIETIGNILRFIGCAPTEKEVQDVIAANEDPDNKGSIHLAKFLPYVCQLLTDKKLQPATPEQLLEAFEELDPDCTGFISADYMAKLMTEEGEPFSKQELEVMMRTAADSRTGLIDYMYYMNQLMVIEQPSVYEMAAKIEADRIASQPVRKSMIDFNRLKSLV